MLTLQNFHSIKDIFLMRFFIFFIFFFNFITSKGLAGFQYEVLKELKEIGYYSSQNAAYNLLSANNIEVLNKLLDSGYAMQSDISSFDTEGKMCGFSFLFSLDEKGNKQFVPSFEDTNNGSGDPLTEEWDVAKKIAEFASGLTTHQSGEVKISLHSTKAPTKDLKWHTDKQKTDNCTTDNLTTIVIEKKIESGCVDHKKSLMIGKISTSKEKDFFATTIEELNTPPENSDVDIVAELDDAKGALYSIDQNTAHKDVSYVHCRKGDQHSVERKTAIIRTGAYHFLYYLFCRNYWGTIDISNSENSIEILNNDAEFCKQFIYGCILDKYPKASLSILNTYKLISYDKSEQYKTGSFKYLRTLFSGKDDPMNGTFVNTTTGKDMCHYELQKLISEDIASDIEKLTSVQADSDADSGYSRKFTGQAY